MQLKRSAKMLPSDNLAMRPTGGCCASSTLIGATPKWLLLWLWPNRKSCLWPSLRSCFGFDFGSYFDSGFGFGLSGLCGC